MAREIMNSIHIDVVVLVFVHSVSIYNSQSVYAFYLYATAIWPKKHSSQPVIQRTMIIVNIPLNRKCMVLYLLIMNNPSCTDHYSKRNRWCFLLEESCAICEVQKKTEIERKTSMFFYVDHYFIVCVNVALIAHSTEIFVRNQKCRPSRIIQIIIFLNGW